MKALAVAVAVALAVAGCSSTPIDTEAAPEPETRESPSGTTTTISSERHIACFDAFAALQVFEAARAEADPVWEDFLYGRAHFEGALAAREALLRSINTSAAHYDRFIALTRARHATAERSEERNMWRDTELEFMTQRMEKKIALEEALSRLDIQIQSEYAVIIVPTVASTLAAADAASDAVNAAVTAFESAVAAANVAANVAADDVAAQAYESALEAFHNTYRAGLSVMIRGPGILMLDPANDSVDAVNASWKRINEVTSATADAVAAYRAVLVANAQDTGDAPWADWEDRTADYDTFPNPFVGEGREVGEVTEQNRNFVNAALELSDEERPAPAAFEDIDAYGGGQNLRAAYNASHITVEAAGETVLAVCE